MQQLQAMDKSNPINVELLSMKYVIILGLLSKISEIFDR